MIYGGFLWRLALVPVLLLVAALAIAIHEIVRDPRLPLEWRRGMNVTAYQPEAFASATADEAPARPASDRDDAGRDRPELVHGRAERVLDRSRLGEDAHRRERPARDAKAQELGFDEWLKPHVDVKDGSFRGEIQPDDRTAWFGSYRAMIEHYADLAARRPERPASSSAPS